MRRQPLAFVLVAASVLLVPTAQAGSLVASGHIEAGGPHTGFMSTTEFTTQFKERVLQETPAATQDGFFFEVPEAGTWITTETTGPPGHDLDIRQWQIQEDNWHSVEYCVTDRPDEVCKIHPDATHGVVVAHRGADLDVDVLEIPEPSEQTLPYDVGAPAVHVSPSWTHADAGGVWFDSVGLTPESVTVEDRSGGPVPVVVCQDSDGDARCGEDGEPRVEGCTSQLDLTTSDVAFQASDPTRVFVEQATLEGLPDDLSDALSPSVCPNPALGGEVTLSYAS